MPDIVKENRVLLEDPQDFVNIAENFNADIMVYANATNPLVSNKTISDCINFYKNSSICLFI